MKATCSASSGGAARGITHLEQMLERDRCAPPDGHAAEQAERAVERRAEPEGLGKARIVLLRVVLRQVLDRAGRQVDVEQAEVADDGTNQGDDAEAFQPEPADQPGHGGQRHQRGQRGTGQVP